MALQQALWPRLHINRVMEKLVKLAPLRRQQASDLAYCLSRPMAERLAAVESLR